MYTFEFTSPLVQFGEESYLLNFFKDGVWIFNLFCSFPIGTDRETMNEYANKILEDFLNG